MQSHKCFAYNQFYSTHLKKLLLKISIIYTAEPTGNFSSAYIQIYILTTCRKHALKTIHTNIVCGKLNLKKINAAGICVNINRYAATTASGYTMIRTQGNIPTYIPVYI